MMRLHLGCLCFIYCIATCMGQYWCSSFMGSARSAEFVTQGGTVPPGTPCCFPFLYRNKAYHECTNADHGRKWCAVESVYQENNKMWGNCRQIETPAPSPDNTCRPPSQQSQEFVTQGGSVPSGTPCCFPFVYNGVFYNKCTKVDHTKEWCAVGTAFSMTNKKWGNCKQVDVQATPQPRPRTVYQCTELSERSQQYVTIRGTVQQGTPCCFPFVYKGTIYKECTLSDHIQPWCAVETVYRKLTNLWGNCQMVPTPAPAQGRRSLTCSAFTNSRTSNQFFTRGGTVPQGTPCCFPFVYKGETYNECTMKDHNQLWCAVESALKEDNKLWGNCQKVEQQTPAPRPSILTYTCNGVSSKSPDTITQGGGAVEGTQCCFPFSYFGQTYFGCITKDHHRAWCAVENVYQRSRKNWGNCVKTATPAPPEASGPFNCDPALNGTRSGGFITRGGTVVQGTPCCFPFSYRGVVYTGCTTVNHRQPWCAVESVFSESNKLWGNCAQVAVPTITPQVPGQFSCSAFKNSAKSKDIVTRGGSVPNGTPCCFPFIYEKKIYNSCTAVDHTRAWCSVEEIYRESDKKWGNCVLATP